jgi:hypothetical protein
VPSARARSPLTSLLDHFLGHGLAQEKGPFQVNLQDLFEGVLFQVDHGAQDRVGPGVVHQDIDSPECPESLLNQTLKFFLSAHMGGNGKGLPAHGLNLFSHFSQFRRASISTGYDEVCSGLGISQGNRPSNPTTSPSDEGYFSL